MGTWCSLTIKGFDIDSSKSYIHPFWAQFLRETDRRTNRVHFSKYFTMPIEQEGELVTSCEYAASVKDVKDRLELLGYSLEKSKSSFVKFLQEQVQSIAEFGFEDSDNGKHLKRLKQIGFAGWVELLRGIAGKIIQEDKSRWEIVDEYRPDDIEHFILDQNESSFLGYPSLAYGISLRGILEAFDDDDEVGVDVTDYIHSGYYKIDEPVISSTIFSQHAQSLPFQKILILTEGSTDTYILSRSMRILYPHLYDYFSFMDFETGRPDGGAPALERNMKTFSAAGLTNRVIGIFDNDAAGVSAFNELIKLKLPDNIRILVLPTLDFAKSYPTIGPQGEIDVDINGRACSIELYVGRNLLKNSDGGFIPVRWGSMDNRNRIYQGEFTAKRDVFDKFKDCISKIENGKITLKDHDWDDIRLILEMIFKQASVFDNDSEGYEDY